MTLLNIFVLLQGKWHGGTVEAESRQEGLTRHGRPDSVVESREFYQRRLSSTGCAFGAYRSVQHYCEMFEVLASNSSAVQIDSTELGILPLQEAMDRSCDDNQSVDVRHRESSSF